MWTEENTTGFTQEELDMINSVRERILSENPGLEDWVRDKINNAWHENISEDELYATVLKRFSRSNEQ